MNLLLFLSAVFVSYANGANDDFKGVATLYGSKILDYRKALILALLTTIAGSLVSFFLASKLLVAFSGKGLVDSMVLANQAFLASIALAAAATVMLATLLRFPVSTTHSIVGAMLGSGIASGGLVTYSTLIKTFAVPLLLGPIIAMILTIGLYHLFHRMRALAGIESSYCLCVGERQEVLIAAPGLLTIRSTGVQVSLAEEEHCRLIYTGRLLGFNAQRVIDFFHLLSGGAVSFARGLNDTPKIAALLFGINFLSPKAGVLVVASFMAIGGVLHSRKIARRMSLEITDMNSGQAFTGNFITAVLVILGSVFGFPLSTTHVSCGSLFGIGILSGTARKNTMMQIVLAWVTTLPLSALIAAVIYRFLSDH